MKYRCMLFEVVSMENGKARTTTEESRIQVHRVQTKKYTQTRRNGMNEGDKL